MTYKYQAREAAVERVLARVSEMDAERTDPKSTKFVDPKQFADEVDGVFTAIVSGDKENPNVLALRQTAFGSFVELMIVDTKAGMLGMKLILANASPYVDGVDAVHRAVLVKKAVASVRNLLENSKRVAELSKSGSTVFDSGLYVTALANAYIQCMTLQIFGDYRADLIDDLIALLPLVLGDNKRALMDKLRSEARSEANRVRGEADAYENVMQELKNTLDERARLLSRRSSVELEQTDRIGVWMRAFNRELKEKSWLRAVGDGELSEEEFEFIKQMSAQIDAAMQAGEAPF